MTEDDLRERFSKIGEVLSAKIITDSETGRSKVFGFVEMASDEDGTSFGKDRTRPSWPDSNPLDTIRSGIRYGIVFECGMCYHSAPSLDDRGSYRGGCKREP